MDASRVVGSEIDNHIVASLLINALALMNFREDTLQIPLMNGPVAEVIALTVKWSFVRKSAPAGTSMAFQPFQNFYFAITQNLGLPFGTSTR
jgi:hypothetical protein